MRAAAFFDLSGWVRTFVVFVGFPAVSVPRFSLTLLLFVATASFSFSAQAPETIDLWPEGPPGLRADASPEEVIDGRVHNVHRPTLTVYRPHGVPATGTAVIVCPGGGYRRLRVFPDGGPDVAWLNRCGITAFVLKYRLNQYGHPAPLQDVLRAIRLIRSRAAEFGVRADRLGIHGTSAGGHLAACAGTLWDSPEGRGGGPLDEVSARPDFLILVYPVVTMREPLAHPVSRESLLGPGPSAEAVAALSVEGRVRRDSPPAFIVAAATDASVSPENAIALFRSLRAAGVSAELHVYGSGSHGDSHDHSHGPTARWPERASEWLAFNGWLSSPVPVSSP